MLDMISLNALFVQLSFLYFKLEEEQEARSELQRQLQKAQQDSDVSMTFA